MRGVYCSSKFEIKTPGFFGATSDLDYEVLPLLFLCYDSTAPCTYQYWNSRKGKRSCLLFNGCRLPSCISARLNCDSFVLHAFCSHFTYSKNTNNIYEMSPGCFQMDNLHFWFKERNTQLWHLLFSEHNTTGKPSNKARLHLALISNWLQKAEEILTIKLFFNGS